MRIIVSMLIVMMLIAQSDASIGDMQDMSQLQHLLDSYHFTYKPQLDVFDCVDMSAANYRFLTSRGYNVSIVIVEDGVMPNGTRLGHCMALVELSGGWVGIETKQATTNTSQSIGKVIGIDPAYIREICLTPDEVYAQDRRGKPVVSGDAIVPNQPPLIQ